MNLDGSGVKRLTTAPGYDGGAFSEDCKSIVWRAARPKNEAEAKEMKSLLAEHLVRLTRMELWVADADGKMPTKSPTWVPLLFAPGFYPASGRAPNRRIIFFVQQWRSARTRV